MNKVKFGTILAIFVLVAGVGLLLAISANSNKSEVPVTLEPASLLTSVHTPSVTIIPLPTGTRPAYRPHSTPDPTQAARNQTARYLDFVFFRQPGTVIARWTGAKPVPVESKGFSLTGYIVEEVTMPQAITADVTGAGHLKAQSRTFDKIWRLAIITEQPFPPSSLRYTLWLDDVAVGFGQGGGRAITTIVFDRLLLREGAKIGWSL